MELLANTSQLFNTLKKQRASNFDTKVSTANAGTEIPIMSRDAKTLEFQLNTHLRLKYKQQSRVTLKGEGSMGAEEVETLMQSFAEKKQTKKKTWKSFALYEKWGLIQEYIRNHSLENVLLQQYQSCLRDQSFDKKYQVQYDHETHKIVDIKLI